MVMTQHGRVVGGRPHGDGSVNDETDAMRTPVLESVNDEIGATRWVTNDADTTYVNDKGRGTDNCGWGNDTLINAKNETAEAATGGGGVVLGAGVDTHTAPRSSRVIETGPNAVTIRSSQARGLKNVDNTCFLIASLQCLVVVQEFGEEQAQRTRQRKTIQSRFIKCIN